MQNHIQLPLKYRINQLEGEISNNNIKKIRKNLLMSKAELGRKAGGSPFTLQRVEQGKNCRMDTKRRIILALGYSLSEKGKILFDDQTFQ